MLTLFLSFSALAAPCPAHTHPAGIEGDVSWCETDDGVRHGPMAIWHPDGVHIASLGVMRHGERHGRWFGFDVMGSLVVEGRYRRGTKVGPWRSYHANGAVSQVAQYRDDHGHGQWTWHRPDGSVEQIGAYRYGQRHGLFVRLDTLGRTTSVTQWESGVALGDPRPTHLRAASARLASR